MTLTPGLVLTAKNGTRTIELLAPARDGFLVRTISARGHPGVRTITSATLTRDYQPTPKENQ